MGGEVGNAECRMPNAECSRFLPLDIFDSSCFSRTLALEEPADLEAWTASGARDAAWGAHADMFDARSSRIREVANRVGF
ncbi:hypothetical protein [Sorangium sp. So ce385]|uniref:hypothetical protein n=1 Tax=Sorangium sp. So ce385 TaxID=3133308 RepID=UPI003F5C3CE5